MSKKKPASELVSVNRVAAPQPPSQVALDRLLMQLAPFLNTLSQEEWTKLTTAEALDMIRRPRRTFLFRPPLPVEVVLVRLQGQVGGVLLVGRKSVEDAIEKSCGKEVRESYWPVKRSELCTSWLDQLERSLSPWLSHQVEFLPHEDDLQWEEAYLGQLEADSYFYGGSLVDELRRTPSPEESFLTLLEKASPEQINRWLGVPSVRRRLRDSGKSGPVKRRQRARAILKSWTQAKRGRTKKKPDEHGDVKIAKMVMAAEERLARGWEYVRQHKSDDRDHVRKMLIDMDYQDCEADTILADRRRRLQSAAEALIAFQTRHPIDSISVRAFRGRKLLQNRK